jgi:ABC-2 type transport system ATP-binding protein
MFKIINVSKSYNKNQVVKNINLEIHSGKITTLLGQNGAGKSTLLRLLSGYELPDSGRIDYKNEELKSFDFSFKHDIKFIHENITLQFSFNMEKYIEIIKEEIPDWDQSYFNQMLDERKIDLKKRFRDYSRGQKMQLALMLSLASKPKVLLIDEITSVIDVHGRKYFLDQLYLFAKNGGTVVITTNIIDELEFYTDHLIIIKNQAIALNSEVKKIDTQFIKLRIPKEVNLNLEKMKYLIWAGVNSDYSVSYIVSKEYSKQLGELEKCIDRRKTTLEDVFIFYFANGACHENVA